MRAIASETRRATDHLASSLADFVKNLFVGGFRLRCDTEPSIMAVAEKVKAKMPDTAVVGGTPRHSSTSNGLQERASLSIDEQLSTLRLYTQNGWQKSELRQTRQSGHGWSDILDCAARYVRGEGGITPFRTPYDRDYTLEITPLVETIRNIVDCRRETYSVEETLRGTQEIWLSKQETNPEHIDVTKCDVMEREQSEDVNQRNVRKPHCCSRFKEIPWTWYRKHRVVGDAGNT